MNRDSLTSDQQRLDELMSRWEEERDQGRDMSIEELTAETPDLAEPLRARIASLRAMDWLDAPTKIFPTKSFAETDTGPPPRTKIPGMLSNRYRMETLIAEGGFAQVWRGFDTILERPVAVKITANECLGEAQRIARLKHHGIVGVYDVGTQEGHCFIVFDLVEGSDLAERIRRDRPTWQQSARIVAEVAQYLQYAHDKCFIHRDIKPANILLDEEGHPVLADLGIAITQCELTHETVTSAGTLAYMSPEQLAGGKKLDARTDIYSLGVVLYELLTGRLPFPGVTIWDLRRQILTEAPAPMQRTFPIELERICLKCLEKDSAQRYATARDLAVDLEAVR